MRSIRSVAAAAACLALSACLSVPGRDRDAPFDVASVEPPDGEIARGQVFRVSFTRPLDLDSMPECAVALAPASSLGDEIIETLSKAEISAAAAAVLECGAVGSGDSPSVLSFAPARTLRPGASYRLVVSGALRDAHGFRLADALGGPYVGEGGYVVPGGGIGAATLAISEVMANPRGDEGRSEYVELYNPSDRVVDMEFFSLAFRDGPVQEIRACGRAAVIPGKGFGLVGGDDFSAPAQAGGVPVGCAKGRLGGRGIVNYAGQVMDLMDPAGRVVSTFTGWLASKSEGRSLERVDLSGPDDASNWGFSAEVGGTPGAENSLTTFKPAPAPRLQRFDPNGSGVDPASRFVFLFSGPVVCPRSDGCVAFHEDAGGCLAGEKGRVEGREEYAGDLVRFSPLASLRAGAGHFVDLSGLTAADGTEIGGYCLPFSTGDGRDLDPPRVRLAFPPDGGAGIPPNLKAVLLEFDEPSEIEAGAVRLAGAGEEMPLQCRFETAGHVAACRLAAALRPGEGYAVNLRGPVRDAAGNVTAGLSFGRFWTANGDDIVAPEFGAEIISATPNGVTFAWSSSELCRAEYIAALALSGDDGREGSDPGFAGEGIGAALLPLAAASYEVEVFCDDPSGNTSNSVFFFAGPETLPPPVAIVEILANPAGPGGTAGFVEIANYGDVPVDIAGWSLGRCGEPDDVSPIPNSGRTMLAPGDRVLLVNEGDVGSFPWGARTIEMPNGMLPRGLSRTSPEQVCLRDAAGAPVSSYGGWLPPPEGYSLERLADAAADAPDAWAPSAEKGGTPAAPRNLP